MKAFGEELLKRRKSMRLSQEKLAAEVGLERAYISRIERGIRQPSLTVLVGLGRALGVKASEMLAQVEDVTEDSSHW